MKIIHKGTPPKEKELIGECRNCGTEVEFNVKEANFVPDARDGNYYVVECPTCKHKITVAE